MITINKYGISQLKIWSGIGIIVIFHLVGLIGIGIFENASIIQLSWFNLVLSFSVAFFFFDTLNSHLIIPLSLVFLLGLMSEVLGVNTGIIYGVYSYGEPLGFKLFGVPITIGIMWLSLSIGTKNSLDRYITKGKYGKVILAAFLMVLFDLLMEPIATYLGYWEWTDGEIPFLNYVTWFIVALIAQLILINVNTKNKVFELLFIIQALFFIGLNIML